jgi:hypothetical protein
VSDGVEEEWGHAEAGTDKGKQRDHGRILRDSRARKRRRMVHDVDFLHGQAPNVVHPHQTDGLHENHSSPGFSIPSSVCLLFALQHLFRGPSPTLFDNYSNSITNRIF